MPLTRGSKHYRRTMCASNGGIRPVRSKARRATSKASRTNTVSSRREPTLRAQIDRVIKEIVTEAYARAGDETNAKKYLFELTSRRSPSATESTRTGDALIDEIMMHRRIELWGEGFRWFDLKRLKLPVDRRDQGEYKTNYSESFAGFLFKAADEGNGNEYWALEIPNREFDYNTQMVRNYGKK